MDKTRQDSLLFRLVNESWRGLNHEQFAKRYRQEVSELSDLVRKTYYTDEGNEIYELFNGLVVLATRNGRWSLWENEARVRQRDHERAWAEFARGYWSKTTPQAEGQYFVRDIDSHKRSIRELRRVNGRLLDITGGMVRSGKVSEWRGDWFVPSIPPIPGSWA